MIVFQNGIETVKTHDVLYGRPDGIRKLATMLIVDMAESNTDMVCDMSEEYPTKADVERVFQGLNDQAIDVLEDNFEFLKEKLMEFLRTAKVTARVRRMDYDTEGKLSDVMVDVSVE